MITSKTVLSIDVLEHNGNVSNSELYQTVLDYAKSGASISSDSLSRILAKSPSIDEDILAGCIALALKGVRDQISRGFPADAHEWASFAYECGYKIRESGNERALRTASLAAGSESIKEVAIEAALSAVSFYRRDHTCTNHALETAHLINQLALLIYPVGRTPFEDATLPSIS